MRISAYAEGLPYASLRLWGTPEKPASGWKFPGLLNEARHRGIRPTIVLEGPGEAVEEARRRLVDLLDNPPATAEEAGRLARTWLCRKLSPEAF